MDKQLTDILEDYIEISANFCPLVAPSWGIERNHLTYYTNKNIQQAVRKYTSLLNTLEELESRQSKFNRALRSRIFKFTEMEIWRDPFFYILNSINGSTIWDTFEAIFEQAANAEIISAQIMCLPEFFDVAIAQLSDVDIPKLDCMRAVNELMTLHEQTMYRLKNELGLPDEDLILFDREINRFRDFFRHKLLLTTCIIRPMGEQQLLKYIYHESGVHMNFELFLSDLTEHLQVFEKDNYLESNSHTQLSDIDFKHELTAIIEHGISIFPLYNDSVYTFQCCPGTKYDGIPLRKFGYFRSDNLTLNKPKGIMMYSSLALSKSQTILGIIHEWYPGHHYSRTIRGAAGYRESILFENTVFEEGWAKYCEYYFAHKILSDNLIIQDFNKGIVKSIILAIAVVCIHAREMTIADTMQWLSNYYVNDKETLKKICIQAYFSPLESISYILGFYSMLSFEIMDERSNNVNTSPSLLRYEKQMEDLVYEQVSALLHERRMLQ